MKTLLKLNKQGIVHTALLGLIIVGTAVVGTYLLVASHADPLTCSPASSPTSSPASSPVSAGSSTGCTPTSSPVSSGLTYIGSCTVTVNPASVAIGKSATATFAVTNKGTGSFFDSSLSYSVEYGGAKGLRVTGVTTPSSVTLPNLTSGESTTTTTSFTVPSNSLLEGGTVTAKDYNSRLGFSCYKNFTVVQ